ncbi:MAG TPA: iron uptake porin [Nostocaceae cyanobacterium]|nr:iron uptake porin [Nostocaceae cyanobacterium]
MMYSGDLTQGKNSKIMKLFHLKELFFLVFLVLTFNPIKVNANPILETENNELSQINLVSQLRDIDPQDWAYEALKNLIEKYNCIDGNADGFYLGDRNITRYEFAAGLNSCLEKITLLTNTGEIKEDDLNIIQQLQNQFSSELTALSTKIDSLENRTLTLQEQQFSTTTKLNGAAWINLTRASTGDKIQFEALPNTPLDARFAGGRDSTGKPLINTISDSQTTLSALTWLTLNTSFTGQDLLTVQLAAGNGTSPINQFVSAGFLNTYGNPYTDQTSGTVVGKPDFVIQDLSYSFPVTEAVKLTIGPRVNWFSYFDFNTFTYYLNGASSYASVASTQSSATFWGSGAVLEWKINPQLMWKASYLGENIPYLLSEFGYNTSSNPDFGLFGGTNSTTSELTYSPTEKLNLRFRYNYTRLQAYGGQVGGGNAAPLPYGYLDAGSGFSVYDPNTGTITSGGLDYAYAHTFAFNFDWLLNPKLGIFGRYSFGNINLEPINETVNVQSWQVGMAFPDLGKKGALGVLAFIAPMDIQTGRQYFVAGGGDGGKIYELEASYYYPVNDHIAIVPAFYAIFNPNNFDSNPNIYVTNLRMQFSF